MTPCNGTAGPARPQERQSAQFRAPDAGPDRGCRDHGERHGEGKAGEPRSKFGVPEDGCQTEGRFEHGKVIADTGSWSATKRQVLPTIAALGVFLAESVRIEDQRMVPKAGIAMHGIDAHHHPVAGFDPVAVDVEILRHHSGHDGCRWAQPAAPRSAPEPCIPIGGRRQRSMAARPAPRPRRPRAPAAQGCIPTPRTRTSTWSPSCHTPAPEKDDQFVANVSVGQLLSGVGVSDVDQRANQCRVAGRVGAAGRENVVGETMKGRTRSTCASAGGSRQPPRGAQRPHGAIGDVHRGGEERLDQRIWCARRGPRPARTETRPAASVGGTLRSRSISAPSPHSREIASALVRHVPGELRHVLPGEHGLQGPSARQPRSCLTLNKEPPTSRRCSVKTGCVLST